MWARLDLNRKRKYHASAYGVHCGSSTLLLLHFPKSSISESKSLAAMAEKEATVYIVDVGKSMGERRHGRSVTDLEWAMQYVWDRITTTVCN